MCCWILKFIVPAKNITCNRPGKQLIIMWYACRITNTHCRSLPEYKSILEVDSSSDSMESLKIMVQSPDGILSKTLSLEATVDRN